MTTPNPFAAPEPGGPPLGPAGAAPPYGTPPPAAGYGPPPPQYGQPEWGSAAPLQGPAAGGWYATPRTDGTAIAVLVLAICSFVVLPVIPAVVALVLAPGAERTIAASGGRLTGEGLVRAGRVVAWVHLGLCLLGVVLLLGFLGLFSAAALSG